MVARLTGLRFSRQRACGAFVKGGTAVALFVLAACAQSVGQLSCDDIEADVVSLAKGNLIKITASRIVSRTPTELICSGTGIYSDNSEILTRYRAYIDEDRELMVAYDTDEAQAAEDRAADRRDDVEAERLSAEFNRQVDDAFAGN